MPTRGFMFLTEWDNRNSENNATRGNRFRFRYHIDPGRERNPGYHFWALQQSIVFPFFSSELTTQQSLAVNLGIQHTVTWHEKDHQGRYRRPPFYAGSTLGGYEDLRGYSRYRYHDRSAVSYNFEYRILPKWQPLGSLPILSWYHVPWWQWVAYLDLARVDDDLRATTFYEDLMWSVGAGVRFEIESILVRLEYAVAEDESQFLLMVNQPFLNFM